MRMRRCVIDRFLFVGLHIGGGLRGGDLFYKLIRYDICII